MTVVLCVFSLGLSILPSCLSFHYEYVNENKNWYEAQRICRENYTDLATFYDNASIPDQTNDAWIGLYSGLWTWSLNGEVLPCNETSCGSDYAPWSGTELQTEYVEDELCVYMEKLDPGDERWKISNCSNSKSFVCYDGEWRKVSCTFFFRFSHYTSMTNCFVLRPLMIRKIH